jgi:hypothetical protein
VHPVPVDGAPGGLEREVLRCTLTHATIYCLAEDVGVAGMPSVLLDHVQEHLPAARLVWSHINQTTRSSVVQVPGDDRESGTGSPPMR